jgi:polysaccharide biosynthesis transport protein
MKFAQILGILKARRWFVLGVLLAVVALVTILSVVLPAKYVASVALVVDSKSTDPVTGAMLPLQFLPGYLATQVDIIASHNVALKVVDDLQLTRIAEVREEFHLDTGGAGSIRDWLADRLLLKLDVRPSRESSVINVDYASSDAHVAAEMANAFTDAYLRTSLELKVDPARRQAGWFEGQVTQLRTAFEAAQQQLTEYQRTNSLLGPEDDRLDVENARLAELSSELLAAQRAMYEADTRQRQMKGASARGRIDEAPDVGGNLLVQNLKAELVRAEARLAEVGGRYDRNHPQYQSAAAELNSLRERLAAELKTAQGSVDQVAQIARRQSSDLQQALEKQKARVLALKQQRDKLGVLTRDMENARAAYDAALQRTTNVRLESRLDQTDVAVLNRAIVPFRPVFPNYPLNLALAVVLGGMLGTALALLLELRDRRVRSRDDLTDITQLLVLAEIGRIGRRRGRRRTARRQAKWPGAARETQAV